MIDILTNVRTYNKEVMIAMLESGFNRGFLDFPSDAEFQIFIEDDKNVADIYENMKDDENFKIQYNHMFDMYVMPLN